MIISLADFRVNYTIHTKLIKEISVIGVIYGYQTQCTKPMDIIIRTNDC